MFRGILWLSFAFVSGPINQWSDVSSLYVRSPRCLEDTSDRTSEAGLLVAGKTTWPKTKIIKQNFFHLTIWTILFYQDYMIY